MAMAYESTQWFPFEYCLADGLNRPSERFWCLFSHIQPSILVDCGCQSIMQFGRNIDEVSLGKRSELSEELDRKYLEEWFPEDPFDELNREDRKQLRQMRVIGFQPTEEIIPTLEEYTCRRYQEFSGPLTSLPGKNYACKVAKDYSALYGDPKSQTLLHKQRGWKPPKSRSLTPGAIRKRKRREEMSDDEHADCKKKDRERKRLERARRKPGSVEEKLAAKRELALKRKIERKKRKNERRKSERMDKKHVDGSTTCQEEDGVRTLVSLAANSDEPR